MPDGRPRITVCRGCCCGTTRKHPEVDHDRQLRVLREALDGVATVRVSDCLDACTDSNVIVVQPSPAARVTGAKPVWLGHVLDDQVLQDVISWIHAGGPGLAPPPPSVESRKSAASPTQATLLDNEGAEP